MSLDEISRAIGGMESSIKSLHEDHQELRLDVKTMLKDLQSQRTRIAFMSGGLGAIMGFASAWIKTHWGK
jgi:uncharacterized protein YoxC